MEIVIAPGGYTCALGVIIYSNKNFLQSASHFARIVQIFSKILTPSSTTHAITVNSSVNFYLNKDEFVVPYSRSVTESYIADGGGFSFSGFYIG